MRRTILIILAVVGLVVIGGYAYLRWKVLKPEPAPAHHQLASDTVHTKAPTSPLDLRPVVIKKLESLVLARSRGLYHLSIGELLPDLINQKLKLRNLVFDFDPALAKGRPDREFYRITLDSIYLSGIGLKDLTNTHDIRLKDIVLYQPDIHIYQNGSAPPKDPSAKATDKILESLGNFSANTVLVKNGKFTLHHKNGKVNTFTNVALEMRDILIDSTMKNDPNRFLFSKSTALSFTGYRLKLRGAPYTLSISKVEMYAPANTATLTDLSLLCNESKESFFMRNKVQKERYTLRVPSVQLKGVDWWALSGDEGLDAREILLAGPQLVINFDRTKPQGAEKQDNFPQQLLMKSKFKMDVSRINVRNMHVRYEEKSPESGQTGVLEFSEMNGSLSNITNQFAPLKQNGTARLVMDGRFDHKVPFHSTMSFNLRNTASAPWTATLSTGGVALTDFNHITEPLGMFRAKSGTLQSLNASVAGTEKAASGTATPSYQDLKVEALEKNGKGEINPRHVSSFLANTFVLKQDNPKNGQALRKGSAGFTHDPHHSFMNLVWKTTLTGILDAVGAPKKLAE